MEFTDEELERMAEEELKYTLQPADLSWQGDVSCRALL